MTDRTAGLKPVKLGQIGGVDIVSCHILLRLGKLCSAHSTTVSSVTAVFELQLFRSRIRTIVRRRCLNPPYRQLPPLIWYRLKHPLFDGVKVTVIRPKVDGAVGTDCR